MAAGHVITSGGGLRAGDLTGINNVRADQTWTYPTIVDSTINTNEGMSGVSDLTYSNPGVDTGRIFIGDAIFDPNGAFIGRSSMFNLSNIWSGGIIGIASLSSSGASGIIRRETRNGALLSNTSFSYNYTGNRVWAYVHDIDPSTGNIVFGFWQNYSSASGNFNIIAFNWSGVKIADFVISNPPWPTGLAISNDSIYFSSANDTNGPGASGGYVSRYTFGGAVVWSRTDMPTYCRWNVRLANSGTGPSGSISTSFDGKVVYVVRSTYRGGSAKAGEICALDASSGSRAGGGRVALQGDYVRFTSKNVDNTFCMNAIFDTGGAASVARFNKNAELLELSSGWSGTYNDYCILRADNKVITIYKRNAPYYFYTYIQYPASPSQWQILE